MNKYLLIIAATCFLWSCEEVGPTVNLDDITYTGRKVIIEEFTGVRCVNCPQGSQKIEELVAIHGDNLIPISIHAGFFAEPYAESMYDFRTPVGTDLESNLLGPVAGYPAASVNRKLFTNEFELPIPLSKWAGYINQELLQQPQIAIVIETDYDPATRLLNVSVALDFLKAISETLGVSVMLTEDKVEDAQLTPSGKQLDYLHRHILRDMLTSFSGDALLSNTDKTLTYSYTIPASWNVDNCHIVAFVSRKGTSDVSVIQAEEASIQ